MAVGPSRSRGSVNNHNDLPAAGSSAQSSTVLVVHSSASIITRVVNALADVGVDTKSARDADHAHEMLGASTYDVVLGELTSTDLGNDALLRAVRARDLDIPVILLRNDAASDEDSKRYPGVHETLHVNATGEDIQTRVRRAIEMSRLARAKGDAIRLLGSLHPTASDRPGLSVTLDRALQSLWLAYQPIVHATDGKLFGYEALLRSQEPSLPHPGAVLSAAERLGRVHDVGQAVRERAPVPMERADPHTLLFINLHAGDLTDERLIALTGPLPAIASRVVLEITERASLEHVPNARERVAQLRQLGYRIAIDDLGAGYAGLTAFAELEPEFVKLDMSLVRDVHLSPLKQKLVKSLTSVCKDMGITVVAEGIEVASERAIVADLGCDLLQGYLFAKPGPPFPVPEAW